MTYTRGLTSGLRQWHRIGFIWYIYPYHWKENVLIFMKFSSLAALEVVILTTSSGARDEKFHENNIPVSVYSVIFFLRVHPPPPPRWFSLWLLHWHWVNRMPQCQWSNSEENHWIWLNRLCDSTEPQWYNHYKTKQNKNLVNFYGIYCAMPVLFIYVSLMWWCD